MKSQNSLAKQRKSNNAAQPSTESCKTVIVRESDFSDADDLHNFFARRLRFPEYYGRNFAALADCLGDISSPVLINIIRDKKGLRHSWFGRACTIVKRSAEENPFLNCEEHPQMEGGGDGEKGE